MLPAWLLAEWDIPPSKILGMVTDGASNMKCAVKSYLKTKWLYCAPHMLNRAISTALDGTDLQIALLKPAKKIARYFRSSNKATLEVNS